MIDIVERAHEYVRNLGGDPQNYLVWQLADEIERLQEELRAVLLHVEDLRAEISVYKFRITQLEDDLIRAISRETGNDTTARNSGSAALRDGAGG